MTIELQTAPEIEIREEPVGFEEPPDMVAHIYSFWSPTPHCGAAPDPHSAMHKARQQYHEKYHGQAQCGLCGAPICPECLELDKKPWHERPNWRAT